jgi:RNA polymerase sigma-70 factor, ECF subfamily
MATEPAAEDRRLLARIATGDEQALDTLYARYRPRLRHYLWLRLEGDEMGVEEALQDTFLAVWESAGGFRGEALVATWVFQIAHNIAAHARQRGARRPASAPLLAAERAGASAQRDPYAEGVVNRLAMRDALARLSEKHREVLDLFFRQGFAADEIAAILGVPAGTVRSRVSYARKALRDALNQPSDPAWRRPAPQAQPAEKG